MKSLFPLCSAVCLRHVTRRGILTTILALAITGSIFAASITGGAVTGGSAFTAGGTFIELSSPWGSVSTPPNTVGNVNFGTRNLYAFPEAQNYTLASTLTTQVGDTSISAGTIVSSFFVTFEPGLTEYQLIGHVDFSAPVLGIVTSDSSLVASNFLGAAGITYFDPRMSAWNRETPLRLTQAIRIRSIGIPSPQLPAIQSGFYSRLPSPRSPNPQAFY